MSVVLVSRCKKDELIVTNRFRFGVGSRKSHRVTRLMLIRNFAAVPVKGIETKILKEVESPAILLELGFLTNEADLAKVSNTGEQQEIAKAIYDGILKGSTIKM